MPFLKSYRALSDYVDEHPGVQLFGRMRSLTYVKEFKDKVERLRYVIPQYERAYKTLQAYVKLTESEKMLSSDLHTAMDAAMLGQKMIDQYGWLVAEARNVYDTLYSMATAPDHQLCVVDGKREVGVLCVVPREGLEKIVNDWGEVYKYTPGYLQSLPSAYGSDRKLVRITHEQTVGVFQTFPPEVVTLVRRICAHYEQILNFLNALNVFIYTQELS